ncbi:MAG: hypothetical protein ACTSWY_14570 [Promethearchaeota archaeon]
MKLLKLSRKNLFATIFFIWIYLTVSLMYPISCLSTVPTFPGELDNSWILTESYYVIRGTGFPKDDKFELTLSIDPNNENISDYELEWLYKNHPKFIAYTDKTIYTLNFTYSFSEDWGFCEFGESYNVENGRTFYDTINSTFLYSKKYNKIKVNSLDYENSLLRINSNIEFNQTIRIYDFLDNKEYEYEVINIIYPSWNFPGRIDLFWEEFDLTTQKNITLIYSINGKFQSRLVQQFDNQTDSEAELSRIKYYYNFLKAETENKSGLIYGYSSEMIFTFSLTGIIFILHKNKKSHYSKKRNYF